MTLLTNRSPRWLGWVLLVSGGVLATLWVVLAVLIAVYGDDPWGDVVTILGTFVLFGILGAIAGFRILRGTGRSAMDLG